MWLGPLRDRRRRDVGEGRVYDDVDPRMSLGAGYQYLMSTVARADGSGQQTLGDAVSVVRDFVDPILAGTATGSWDPVTLRWRRRF